MAGGPPVGKPERATRQVASGRTARRSGRRRWGSRRACHGRRSGERRPVPPAVVATGRAPGRRAGPGSAAGPSKKVNPPESSSGRPSTRAAPPATRAQWRWPVGADDERQPHRAVDEEADATDEREEHEARSAPTSASTPRRSASQRGDPADDARRRLGLVGRRRGWRGRCRSAAGRGPRDRRYGRSPRGAIGDLPGRTPRPVGRRPGSAPMVVRRVARETEVPCPA